MERDERLSNSALKALYRRWQTGKDEKAHDLLWMAGERMVNKLVSKFIRQSLLTDDDAEEARQVGRLAVGEALHQWEPDRGAYSTFVWTVIRNSLIAYGKNQSATRFAAEVDDLLDEDYLAETVEMDEQILELLRGSQLAYEYWVLGYTQEELADLHQMSQSTISKKLDERRLVIEDMIAWGASGLSSDNRY